MDEISSKPIDFPMVKINHQLQMFFSLLNKHEAISDRIDVEARK